MIILIYRLFKPFLNKRIWKKAVMMLSCIVVFITTYMLILPAISLDQPTAEDAAGLNLHATTEETAGLDLQAATEEAVGHADASDQILNEDNPTFSGIYFHEKTSQFEYRTPYMNIFMETPGMSGKLQQDIDVAVPTGMEVIEAFAAKPRSAHVRIVVTVTALPEAADGEFFEICTESDGELTSLGAVYVGSQVEFTGDTADAFALIKRQMVEQTLTSEEGIILSGLIPQSACVSVDPLEAPENPNAIVNLSYDIKILKQDGCVWQPEEGETIEVVIPCEGTQEELEEYYWAVYHTSEDGETEQLLDAYPVDSGIRFTTTSFSTFTLQAQVTSLNYWGKTKVHFVDHLGNEIQGAIENGGTYTYSYRVPFDMYTFSDQLDPSIADEYEFSRVYLQLTNMQKDFRYIYLGTNSDAGYSGSAYKIYFNMNGIDENREGGTYKGTFYTFSSGVKWSDDVYIVFYHVADTSFYKVDSEGEPVQGAEFTLYTDSNCVSPLVYMDQTATATSDGSGLADFGRIPYGTYYMKETTTPSGFKETGTVYTVTVDGTSAIENIINEEDDGSVLVGETKTMNISKTWSDGTADHTDDTVTIKVYNAGSEAGSVTLSSQNSWSGSITGLDPTVSYLVSETQVTSDGEDITNEWIPEMTSVERSPTTGYYKVTDFEEGEQYVLVYNGNRAISGNTNYWSASSLTYNTVSTSDNLITSSVNNNMLWTVESVSNDGVIALKNVYNNRYLDLNYPSYSTRSWQLLTDAPQFVRYTNDGETVKLFYRENMNAATPYYMQAVSSAVTSESDATSFTLYKKINVRTVDVTVNNKPAEYPVRIDKLDYISGDGIGGAVFSLYSAEEYPDGTALYTGLTSSADGRLQVNGTDLQLLAGTYYLVETAANDDYVALTKPVIFTISRGGRLTAPSSNQEFTSYNYISSVTEDGTVYPQLKVPNEKKVTLTFKAEDGVSTVSLTSGSYLEIAGNSTSEMTVVIGQVTGGPITVTGTAASGRVLDEWTIDGNTLTTDPELTTAVYDVTGASAWNDRTYILKSEAENTITVTKQVKVIGSLDNEEIDGTVYFALTQNDEFIKNADNSIYTASISITDGVPSGTVQFTGLKAGTYEVWEMAGSDTETKASPGMTLIPGTDIVVSRIQTWITSNVYGNNVTVSDGSDGSITVINTLSKEGEALTFRANKKWYNEKNNYLDAEQAANVDVPSGARVEFTLYRVNYNGTEEAIQTITLDGAEDVYGEDEAWVAAFRDLSNKDSDGYDISYYVKETDFSSGASGEYYTTFDDETSTNGGAIKNVVAYGTLNLTKTVEIPVGTDADTFLNALTITVAGPSELASTDSNYVNSSYSADDFEKTNVSTDSGIKITLTKAIEVPAGTYTVSESGYDADGLPAHWVNSLSWTKADKTTDSSISGIEQTGVVSTQVQVGMNTADSTNVYMNNNYQKLQVTAVKEWDDKGLTGMNHPAISLTLSRKVGESTQAIDDGTHTIAADASGDALTTTWEDLDYNFEYVLEEGHIDGFTALITGNQVDGFTVTNTRDTETVTVTKTLNDTTAKSAVEFGFTLTLLSEDDAAIAGYTVYTDTSDSSGNITTDANGQAQFTLSVENGSTVGKTFSVPYGTKMTVAETMNRQYDTSITVTDETDSSETAIDGVTTGELHVEGDTTVAFVNTLSGQKVSVWKTDLDHTALTGAGFELYRAEDYDDEAGEPKTGATAVVSGSVGTDGLLSLGELPVGSYRLVETVSPPGYDLETIAISITVRSDEVTAMQETTPAEVIQKGDSSGYWVDGQDESVWQVRVWNNPGVALPSTGGPGTRPVRLLGLGLVLAALIMLYCSHHSGRISRT